MGQTAVFDEERAVPGRTERHSTDTDDPTASTTVFDDYDTDRAQDLVSFVTDGRLWDWDAQALADDGFTRQDSTCSDCNAHLWARGHEVVCEKCAKVFDGEDRRRSSRVSRADPWAEFQQSRDAYRSGKKRCVGGYPHAYSWTRSSDLDRYETVSSLAPGEFYR